MRVLAIGCALGLSACDLDLPDEYRIEDLRPINVRVEPPEITVFQPDPDDPLSLDPDNLPPPDFRPVTFTALFAHPDLAATFRYEWVRCDTEFNRLPCDGDRRSRLDPTPTDVLEFSPIELLFEDLIDAGEEDLIRIAQLLADDPRDLINGFYLNVNVEAAVIDAAIEVDTQQIGATKRLVVFDPRIVATAIDEAMKLDPSQFPMIPGTELPTLCTQIDEAERNRLRGYLERRLPNQSPEHRGVLVEIEDRTESATRTVVHGETVEIEEGEVISLLGLVDEADAEAYELIDANCGLVAFDEVLAFSWFTTGGTLSRQLTEEGRSNRWQGPTEESAKRGRYRIYSVLRDGRGGSDDLWFDVLVKPG